ncbi:hypothetical protein KR054_007664, partial [Drosophila jambulina]
MDPAYVKFMMCQCLLNRADWGLAVGCMNVVYSIFLFLFWLVELLKSLDNYPVKWVVLYGFNIMFNVITMMRIVKRESVSVFYWACGTGALLMFRVYHLYYVPDAFYLALCELYILSNIFVDVYIGLSLVAMVYVMCGLHLEPGRMFPKEDMVNDYVYNPEAAAQNMEQLHEKLKEKRLEMVREMENMAQIESKDEVENDSEMDEMNRKVILKLAGIMEDEAQFSSSPSQPCEPTAPEEMDSYDQELFPEPTAPPESKLSFDEDFHCE